MNIEEVMTLAVAELQDAAVAEPRLETAFLLSFVLDHDRTFVHAHPEYVLSDAELSAFRTAIKRRSEREPLQYITGCQEFWRLEFAVTPDVLIPRPETEILVEAAIDVLDDLPSPRFCEVGTGSGCIAVSILHSVSHASAIATDISPAALLVAGRNAQRHGVSDRLELRNASIFDTVTGRFDLIVSNPPYVPDAEIASLQAEVREHEPLLALSGGSGGFDIISQIVEQSPRFMRPGGSLLMEIGFDQADRVSAMFDSNEWESVELLPDLQSIPRIVYARLR